MTVLDTAIDAVFAWEAPDSRGNPTVAAEVTLLGGARGIAAVPSGASTGTYEARELWDGGTRYGGKGVRTAVANANGPLARAVHGIDAAKQELVDAALREADGTASLSHLGANAVLKDNAHAGENWCKYGRANGLPHISPAGQIIPSARER